MPDQELSAEVLKYFLEDGTTMGLYENLRGYGKSKVQKIFFSLKNLGFIAKTNSRKTSGATYATTRTGRELLDSLSTVLTGEPA